MFLRTSCRLFIDLLRRLAIHAKESDTILWSTVVNAADVKVEQRRIACATNVNRNKRVRPMHCAVDLDGVGGNVWVRRIKHRNDVSFRRSESQRIALFVRKLANRYSGY